MDSTTDQLNYELQISQKMRELKVVPDVLCGSPKDLADLIFPNIGNVSVAPGNELTPTQVKEQPDIIWNAEYGNFYTICMIDPDAPDRIDPYLKEWLHWLVVNIPGNKIDEGEILAEYIGAAPPGGSGLHRYIILVYEQDDYHDFNNMRKIRNNCVEGRTKFYIRKFAKEHKFKDLIAANVFLAQWDTYVPKVYKILGLD